jgi:hypothetical protein
MDSDSDTPDEEAGFVILSEAKDLSGEILRRLRGSG